MTMKKSLLIFICSVLSDIKAQSIYKGVGIFGALTQSAHYYENLDTDKKGGPDTLYKYYSPQTHISKEFFNWGAGIFLELGKDRVRWQTELEYCNKGAKEMGLVNAYTGDRTGVYSSNKNTYIQWNNYAKFYYPLGNAHWYFMLGARAEYLFRQSLTVVYPPFTGIFPTFWFSADAGLGYEIPLFKKFSAFVEYHYNPDVLRHTHDNTKIRNRTLELRAGIVMRPRKRQIDDCNAPVYRGPAY
jgi:hypothetical protein